MLTDPRSFTGRVTVSSFTPVIKFSLSRLFGMRIKSELVGTSRCSKTLAKTRKISNVNFSSQFGSFISVLMTIMMIKKRCETLVCLGGEVEIFVLRESVGVGSLAGDDKSRTRCSLSPLGLVHTSFGQLWEADTDPPLCALSF